jgi:hypothetical protein
MNRTKWTITVGACAAALAHLIWPGLTIDAVTAALLLIAVSPWLGAVFKAIEIPGGLKIEYQELEKAKEKAEEAGLLSPKEGVGGGGEEFSFEAISDRDPNLALAGLRIEIERRLNGIAQSNGIRQTGGIGRLLPLLESHELLTPRETAALRDMIGLLNSAVHGATVDPSAAAWALEVGPSLLRVLDEKAQQPG